MVKFRKLHRDWELEHYRTVSAKKIDVLLPMEYLKRSHVVGCFDDHGKLAGGYMIVKKGPFRVLESIPKAERSVMAKQGMEVDSSSTCEITGLWMNKSVCCGKVSAVLWLRMYKDILMSGKSKFVYAYTLRKPGLGALYSVARPDVLFSGMTQVLPGMDEADPESVEVVHIKNIVMAPFRSPQFLSKRILASRKHSRRRAASAVTAEAGSPLVGSKVS